MGREGTTYEKGRRREEDRTDVLRASLQRPKTLVERNNTVINDPYYPVLRCSSPPPSHLAGTGYL